MKKTLKITEKQRKLCKSYKRLGYSDPELQKSGRVRVEKSDKKTGMLIVQIINEHGTTVNTFSEIRKKR